MLFFTRHSKGEDVFCDINAVAIDDFYYENLGFDSVSHDARRLFEILDKTTQLLRDQKRPKIIGHEAMHLVLLVDSLLDDYTRSWETNFAAAFDDFREHLAQAKLTRNDSSPSEYWLRYGVLTRVNSDRGENIRNRHLFFSSKMLEVLKPQLKDPKRLFGSLEREIIYYRDKKKCAVCDGEVIWSEADIHHIEEHTKGGPTKLENGVLVHRHCHPKGPAATEFARQWRVRNGQGEFSNELRIEQEDITDEEGEENSEAE